MGEYKLAALLPFKVNSERVKNKNFRDMCGKPLFRHILDTLLSMDEIDIIVINTDGRSRIEECGLPDDPRIFIRDRASNLCGDHVSMNRIIADDIRAVSADRYIMTHCTNPLLRACTIRAALQKYDACRQRNDANSLFSVQKTQTRFYRADGTPVNHDPDNLIPTQELEPWYEENSNFYIFSSESFADTQARIGSRPCFYEMPSVEGIDIDTEDQWELAEAVIHRRYARS